MLETVCGTVQWNSYVHRLDLGLYSHPKEFWGNGVRTMLIPRGKSPLPEKFSPEEDRTHNAVSSRTASPTHHQQTVAAPIKRPVRLLVLSQGFSLRAGTRTEQFQGCKEQVEHKIQHLIN